MAKNSNFFGGIPTAPDIARMREQWPEERMKDGDIIAYKEVEDLLGYSKGSQRWATVTTRWRRLIEDETGRIVIGTRAGVGFVVLADAGKVDMSHGKLRSAARAARRSCEIAGRVERRNLTPEDQRRLDHSTHVSTQLLMAAQVASKKYLPEM